MTATDCTHKITLVNFEEKEVVSYSIVRLVGLVEFPELPKCQKEVNTITLSIKNTKIQIPLKKNKFKKLLELSEGKNDFTLGFGCQQILISLEYCPLNSEYSVMPMYVICEGHDGLFQAPQNENNDIKSACARILLCSKLLQCFTAEKLLENGLGRKTFNLENKCQIFKSKVKYLDARKMNQEELWQCIGRDIMNSELSSHKRKYLAFLSCTFYNGGEYSADSMKSHEDFIKITEAYVALGGGGLALFGTACLYTWPEYFDDIINRFENKSSVDKSRFLDDSCYRGTQGSCFSTTLGSVLHELYHTFDLGHTEAGVMGRGFDNISKFFTFENNEVEEEIFKRYHNQIEFKEELESDTLSERLVKEHKKKDFYVTKKFEENDWTFLTKSCAVILAYHKWLNNYPNIASCTLTYDTSNKFIRSTSGVRVVEIRKQPDEMIIYNWTFEGKILKFSFRLPDEVLNKNAGLTLFIEDNMGNVLKKSLE